MKKNRDLDIGRCSCVVRKIWLAMRIWCVFMLLGLTTVAARSHSQVRLNLSLKEVSLAEVFKEISRVSGYEFVYSSNELKDYARVNVEVKDEELEAVLAVCLRNTKLWYVIEDKIVLISPKVMRPGNPQDKSIKVKGKVSAKSGEALPGVTVAVKGTTIGVTTNTDGEYEITLPDRDDIVLRFSFVGMRTKEFAIKGNETLNIVLEENIESLDEVIVNGLFNQRKESYTGAANVIKGDDLLRVSQTNLFQALTILTPGLRIIEDNKQGSNPNHVPELILRGMTSISASEEVGINRPLIILDGVEITLEQLYDLDMFEIDRVDVLKDASATAMYGDKAANGVIVVTRKRVEDSKLKVRYSFVPNVAFPDVSSFNLCSPREKLELERLYGLYDSPTGAKDADYYYRDRIINKGGFTDWASIPLRNTWSLNNSLNMSGRGGGLDYSASLRYNYTRGVMKGDHRQNYGFGVYFSYFYKKINISFRSDWSTMDFENSPYGSFNNFVAINPYDMPKDEEGRWNKRLSYDRYNPLYEAAMNSFSKGKNQNFMNFLTMRWDIGKGFIASGSANVMWLDSRNEDFESPESERFADATSLLEKGTYEVSTSQGVNLSGNIALSYHLALDRESTTMLIFNVGSSISKNTSNANMYSGIGFLKPSLNDLAFATQAYRVPSGSESIGTSVGWYGNINFTMKDRYFVDASYRISGGSNYGVKSLYAPYWSLGVGWNVHNEKIFKEGGWMNTCRFRGSLGYVGSGNFGGVKPYTMYNYSTAYYYYTGLGANPGAMGNDRLKSQRTLTLNGGLVSSFFNDRLQINFDVYSQQSKDLLLDVSVPPSVGIQKTKDNLGESLSWGWEWSISAQIIKTKDFFWQLSWNGNRTHTKIKKISNSLKKMNDENRKDESQVSPKMQLEEGEAPDAIYAVRSYGIDPASGQEIFITKDGKYTFEYNPQDKVALGRSTPKLEGSMGSSFRYKNISLNMAFSFRFGGYIYNETRANKIENIDPTKNVDRRAFTLRWKNPGDIVDYVKPDPHLRKVYSQRFVEKQNEFLIPSLGVTYDMNPNWVKKIGLKRLMLGMTFSDVLRLSTIRYERGTSYPYMRTFNFRISPTF